ncbi:MAG: TatD family hydrolase [Patescibacteria group bacterium]|jgi:TatD DNase family protein
MFIDTHCHLNFPEFKNEISAVIGRAVDAGVNRMVNVGIDLDTSKRSLELARRYPEVYATVGIHPHCSPDLSIETWSDLSVLAAHPKVVAIGEIGLDYYYLKRSSRYADSPSREDQIFCFERMLDLALETKLPVIIHSREADADMLGILKSYSGSLRGVFHCFSGDTYFAEKVLDLGFAISFTGNITYKKSVDTCEAIERIPLGSIMIETDAPYLAPEPFRGQRNEPAHVVDVAQKIAEIKKLSLAEVERETTKKAKKLFGIE